MTFDIGTKLKALRRGRDITQEELAAVLGVSGQAVSKWERGDGLPDLPLIPTIAAYFGVTTDSLLGMETLRDAARMEEYHKQINEYRSRGRLKESADLTREMLKAFPENWSLWSSLAFYLSNGDEKEEAIEIWRRVMEQAPSYDDRLLARLQLCFVLPRDEAVKLAAELPYIAYSKDVVLPCIERGETRVSAVQNVIVHATDLLSTNLKRLARSDKYNDINITTMKNCR